MQQLSYRKLNFSLWKTFYISFNKKIAAAKRFVLRRVKGGDLCSAASQFVKTSQMIRLRQNFTLWSKTGKLFYMDGGFLLRFEEEINILLICVVAVLSKLANYDKYSSELTTAQCAFW